MTSLLNALNAGKTSLLTNQKSIEIVGNNIANVNTPGYSRQRAELTQIPSVAFGDFFVGQGVTVSDINRDYSVFITRQLQDKSVELGNETGRSTPLTELERIFSVSEDNLAAKINDYFDSWQQLSTNPSGRVERDSVIQQGQMLGDAFGAINDQLDNVVNNMNTEIIAGVGDINGKLAQIAQLNDRIHLVEISGQSDNAARDQRDLLIQDLSEKLGIETYADNRGMVNVQLPGGLPLVVGNQAMTIKAVPNGTDVELQLEVVGTSMNIANENLGGEFRGIFDIRDDFISSLRNSLDTLAKDLTSKVNEFHGGGQYSDPTDGSGQPGGLFFNDLSTFVTGASKHVQVFKDLVSDSRLIAAGLLTAAPGDNQNALRIAQLENGNWANNNTETFESSYSQMVSNVGLEAARNKLALTGAKDAATQLQNLRDGYSGVSLEEEMIDLMQFQRGFQSSAKFLATVDEMMNSLLQVKQ